MSLSEHVDYVSYKKKYDLFLYYDHLSDKAGGFLFGKIAPMVEQRTLAPRGIGSSPILPTS